MFLLSHPFTICLLLLWIGNDFCGKSAIPSFVTGKLSDLTGLIVTPLFVGGLFSFAFILLRGKSKYSYSKHIESYFLTICILLTDIFFLFINWQQDWNDFVYLNILNSLPGAADRTDLFCIPISWLFLSYYYIHNQQKSNFIEFREVLTSKSNFHPGIKFAFVSILCIFALVNTSRPGGSMVRLVLQESERDVKAGEKIPILFYTSCSLDGVEIIVYKDSNLYLKERIDKRDLAFLDDQHNGLKLRKFEYTIPKNMNPGKYRWEILLLSSNLELGKCHETSDLNGHNMHEFENVSSSRIWRISK